MEDTFNFQGNLTYIVHSCPDLRVKTSFILEFMIHWREFITMREDLNSWIVPNSKMQIKDVRQFPLQSSCFHIFEPVWTLHNAMFIKLGFLIMKEIPAFYTGFGKTNKQTKKLA